MTTLTLETGRGVLSHLEDTIIRTLVERSNFVHNPLVYQEPPCDVEIGEYHGSYFKFIAEGTELVHAAAGRYKCADEVPFFITDPAKLKNTEAQRKYDSNENGGVLFDLRSNATQAILNAYLDALPKFCKDGDDGRYADTCVRDTLVIQAIAQRVHYGMVLIEIKYQKNRAAYDAALNSGEMSKLLELMKDYEQEERVHKSVIEKSSKYGLDVDFALAFYRDTIMRLTFETQIDYVIRAHGSAEILGYTSPDYIVPVSSASS
eukprot:Clim_evm10s57 gene=Clim_evmTU10s57